MHQLLGIYFRDFPLEAYNEFTDYIMLNFIYIYITHVFYIYTHRETGRQKEI